MNRLAIVIAAAGGVALAAIAGLVLRSRLASRPEPPAAARVVPADPHPVPAAGKAVLVEEALPAPAGVDDPEEDLEDAPFRPGSPSAQLAAGRLEEAAAAAAALATAAPQRPAAPTPLLIAADWGEAGEALALDLLERGADPKVEGSGGRTALHLAAREGLARLVAALLRAGADPGVRTELGTPLSLAASEGHLAVVQVLLERGAADDDLEPLDRTALARAAAHGHLDVLRALLARRPASEALSAALVAACAAGQVAAAPLLLQAGAPRDGAAPDGRTPLLAAVEAGRAEVAAWLVEHGASADLAGAAGEAPVVVAGRLGWPAVVDVLLAHGAAVPDDDRRLLLGRAEPQPDGKLRRIHATPVEGGWDGPVYPAAANSLDPVLTLRLPERAFRDPRRPDWNGQVLAQTLGLVEGDTVAVTGGAGLFRLGPLLPRDASTGRGHFRIPLYAAGQAEPGRRGLPVHPEFLRDLDRIEHAPAEPWPCRGPLQGARGPSSGNPEPPPAGDAGLARALAPAPQDAGIELECGVDEAGARAVRAVAGERKGPWVTIPEGEGEIGIRARTWRPGGALDRIVLELGADGDGGWSRVQAPRMLWVVRLRPDLSLQPGRPWRYPPPAARVSLDESP